MIYDINKVLSTPKFDLNKIFSELTGEGGIYEGKQKELGKLVGIDQTTVSRLKGGGMPELADHWHFSLRVLFLCLDLGMITERDLLGIGRRGPTENNSGPTAGKAKSFPRRKEEEAEK